MANKAQIQRIHRVLEKMQDERPQFNNADKMILQNLFNKMVDLITNNKQIFMRTRQAVREETEEQAIQITENVMQGDPPFVLVLKRKGFRLYPNGLKVAVYFSDKLGRYFSVPYTDRGTDNPIQFEELVLNTLQQVVENNQTGIIELKDKNFVEVEYELARDIVDLLDSLNESNKEKALGMIGESVEQFNLISNFAKEKAK